MLNYHNSRKIRTSNTLNVTKIRRLEQITRTSTKADPRGLHQGRPDAPRQFRLSSRLERFGRRPSFDGRHAVGAGRPAQGIRADIPLAIEDDALSQALNVLKGMALNRQSGDK